MLVQDRYNDSADAYQQLHSTYVEIDGELAFLQQHDDWMFSIKRPVRAKGRKPRWGGYDIIDLREADLNLEPLRLGYMNYESTALYVRRRPLRKWKQGIYVDYLEAISHNMHQPGNRLGHHRGGNPGLRNLFEGQSLIDQYDGNYPTFARAFVEVDQFSKRARAFSREWAFGHVPATNIGEKSSVGLFYKGKQVGEVQGGNTVLYHEFKYLSETFVEAMIHAS